MMPNVRTTTENFSSHFTEFRDPHRIRKKSIDRSSHVGFFYNTVYDRILAQGEIKLETIRNETKHSKCKILPGEFSTSSIDYLEQILDDQELFQSLLLRIIQPSGLGDLFNNISPIDDRTRFFYYNHHAYVDRLNIKSDFQLRNLELLAKRICATHLITEVTFGFEVLCIFRINDETKIDEIDAFLNEILRKTIENRFIDGKWSREEINLAHQIDILSLYGSKTFTNNCIPKFLHLLQMISKWQNDQKYLYALEFQMISLREIFHQSAFLYSRHAFDIDKIRSTIIKNMMIRTEKDLNALFNLFLDVPEDLSFHNLNQQKDHFKEKYDQVRQDYRGLQIYLRTILIRTRLKQTSLNFLFLFIIQHKYSKLMPVSMEIFQNRVKHFINKISLVQQFEKDQIEYFHVDDLHFGVDGGSINARIDQALYDRFSEDHRDLYFVYSTDRLLAEQKDRWARIHNDFVSSRLKSPKTVKLMFIDVTNSQYKLDTIKRVEFERKKLPRPYEMNVLIIGETGVGKSTFINAFVNYLAYQTLDEAENETTITALPASFLITTGYNFDETRVHIGEPDPNEDFNERGASVTQHCRSYIIPLRSDLHLRLIDTPGMGDTRGIEQDAINIDHILTYLSTLSHLHAILFVLKPNVSRLNIFFRLCLQQLFTYLTPHAYENIMFAFTSARSTFYAPGDTAPSLRKMLTQNNFDAISFGKRNVFCFDNEAFRYLATIRQGLTFDDIERNEFVQSWTKSVDESVRLLKHIQTREPYALQQWQSDRRMMLEIRMIARPLIVKLRLMLYEILGIIITIKYTTTNENLCSECCLEKRQNVGGLWICDYVAEKKLDASTCRCPDDGKRFLIESIVEYQLSMNARTKTEEELCRDLHEFLVKCDQLTSFVQEKRYDINADPFRKIFDTFKRQEEEIRRETATKTNLNEEVLKRLETIIEHRQRNQTRMNLSLNEITQVIDSLKQLNDVDAHLKCVKKSHQIQAKASDRFIKKFHIRNAAFEQSISMENGV